MKHWFSELLKNTLTLSNEAIGKFQEYGFFLLRPRDLYFLPVNFFIYALGQDTLENNSYRLAPHIVQNPYFKKYICNDSGYDTVN